MFDKSLSFTDLGLITGTLEFRLYKFTDKNTKTVYHVRVELHDYDVFAVKFYRQRDEGSGDKYSKVFNDTYAPPILATVLKIFLMLNVK